MQNLWASYDYRPVARNDDELREKIRELAHQRRRFGCPRIHLMLRRAGMVVNHKRTERIYREEGLSLRKRNRRKTAAMVRVILPAPIRPNERWSMDFVTDSIVTGRRFRALVIVDDYSRECPVIEVETSLGGRRVVNVLEKLAEISLVWQPDLIVMDVGKRSSAEVPPRASWPNPRLMASGDMVAIDVEAVKILKSYPAENRLEGDPYDLPQIATAVEHGLTGAEGDYQVVE